ncbi:alpha/beta fold hydrolase, partial [Streptomyces rochei]
AEGFAQGAAAGYARDTVLAMSRWPFALDAVTVPVDIWYGEEDTGHSPDNGALLATRIPGARRHVVPGIGGALLWTHAEPVLTSLLRHHPLACAKPRSDPRA